MTVTQMVTVLTLWTAGILVCLVCACGGSGAAAPTSDEGGGSSGAVETGPALTTNEAEMRLRDGRRALAEGDPSRAERSLEPLVEIDAYRVEAAYHLGIAAQMEGRADDAVRYYERALTGDPTMSDALLAIVRLELADGDADGADLTVQRALASSQNAPAIRAAGLFVDLYRGRYENVIEEARDILIDDEGNLDAHLALALAYHRLGQSELSKLVLREALARNDRRADMWLALANIQIDEDNEVAAIQSLRSAVAMDPYFVEAHNNLGALLHRARNDEEAIEHLRQAVDLRPDYLQAWLNLSNAFKATGELVAAERAIERVISLDPSYAPAYFNLGLLYLDTEFPGMTRAERYQASITQLNRYREEMGAALPRDDPVEDYINEAIAALEAERQLEQLGAPPAFDDDDAFEEAGDDAFEQVGDDAFEQVGDDDFEEIGDDEFEEIE